MVAPRQPRVSVWPLLHALRDRPDSIALEQTSPVRRTLQRGIQSGTLTVWSADRLAVEVLGVRPSVVWADWFDLA